MVSVRSLSRRLSHLRKLVARETFPLDNQRVKRSIQFYQNLIQYHPTKSPLFAHHFEDVRHAFAAELLDELSETFPVRDWMDLCATFEMYDSEAESLLELLLEKGVIAQFDYGARRRFEKQ